MTARRGHSRISLLALAIALLTAFFSGVVGPSTLLVASLILVLAIGRDRGARLAHALERPRLFAVLGVLYLLFFLVDLFVLGRINPVPALGRLVIFLVAAELLAGDASRGHRPVLFGLLLMVASAAQTTDFWFALPLAAFTWAAVCAQMRHSLTAGRGATRLPARAGLSLTLASLVAGGAFFLVIPRIGAGWGRATAGDLGDAGFETGLSTSVRLGAVGRIKVRRTVAFRAKLNRDDLDLDTIYWRARSYDNWTGDGWSRGNEGNNKLLSIPANETVPVPPEYGANVTDVVADVTTRGSQPALVVPGRGLWVRSPRDTALIASPDGTLAAGGGFAWRSYQVGARLERGRPGDALRGPAAGVEPVPTIDPDGDAPEPEVVAWARGIAPMGAAPSEVVERLLADLSKRPYSLDTRGIDSGHPVASFLAGAPAHCEYFATALALGLRARGIPARVAAGYLGAERMPFSDELVVRDSRAHLWTEVYLPERGWVRFDPTPAAGRVAPPAGFFWASALLDRVVIAWDSWVIGLDLSDQVDLLLNVRGALAGAARRIPWALSLWPALALSSVLLGSAAWLRRRRRGRQNTRGLPRLYRRFLALAARRGLEPLPAETAGEFARRAGEALGDRGSVDLLRRLYERERFGGRPPLAEEARAAQGALELLRGRPAAAGQRGSTARLTSRAGSSSPPAPR